MNSSYSLKQEAQLGDKANGGVMGATAPAVPPHISPGQQLQTARINLHYTVAQVAESLHLTCTVVNDIENDRFDKGLPFTYVRGYLRAFARLVQISPEPIIEAFDQLGLEDQRRAVKMPLKSVKRPVRINWSQLYWIFSGLLIAMGLAGLIWWFNQPIKSDPVQQDLMQLLQQITLEKTTVGEQ